MPRIFPIALLAVVIASEGGATPARSVDRKDAAAVLAADKAWGDAEERGDAAFVDWLLLPGYVSVGHDGVVHTKAMIVEGARKQAGRDTKAAAAKNAAWRVAHPYRSEVKLFGDTAVASFVSIKPGSGEPINSSDVFVYQKGHWHAIYSQHSTAGS